MRIQSPAHYRGGKFNHLDFLLPKFPESHTYIELFGGMGAVMWNKRPISFRNIYNDLDDRLVCVFEVIRDNHEELNCKLSMTPWSRQEYENMIDKLRSNDFTAKVEKARCVLGVISMNLYKSLGRMDKNAFTCSMNIIHGRQGIDHHEIIKKVAWFLMEKKVAIENLPAEKLMRRVERNAEDAFVYVDPPYLASLHIRGADYQDGMSPDDHESLLNILKKSKHKIAISNYPCEMYNDMLSDWHLDTKEVKSSGNMCKQKGTKNSKTECLWRNYEVEENLLSGVM